MTLINTNKINLKKFGKEYYGEKIFVFLFSFLPISFILGNAGINLNILAIDLFFLFICFRQKEWHWIKSKYLYFFVFIWIYLVLNSAISFNTPASVFDSIEGREVYPKKESIIRSVSFLRFVIFLFAFKYVFANSKKIFGQILIYWSIIISVVLIDIIFESIFGHNILGFKSTNHERIVSFFEDELVVGNLVLGFGFLISGFLLQLSKNNSKKKIISNIFFLFVIIGIYLSGERANFAKGAIIFFTILLFINNVFFVLKKKYIFLLFMAAIILSTLISENIYSRQIQLLSNIGIRGIGTERNYVGKYKDTSFYEKYGHIRHVAHYDVAWNIFKDYPIFGVGNSKFRFICHDEKYYNSKIHFTSERCSNHPHQIHLEILSEQGIVGYLIIIFAIFHVLLNSFIAYKKTRDIIHLSSILFVVTFFIPLLPSGSFFSSFNGAIFWINFSLINAFLNKPK